MNSGSLRHKILFYSIVDDKNSVGQVVEKEEYFATVWAGITSVSGTERFLDNKRFAEATHKINCRFVDGITPKHIIKFKNRTFNILYSNNIKERNIELEIIAKELI